MKILKVNEKCDGCGLCIMNCKYLKENEEGNAEFEQGKLITDSDLETVKKVVEDCPKSAIEIVEINSTNKKGMEGVYEIVQNFKRQISEFSIAEVKISDVEFDINDYDIEVPYTDIDELYSYSSEMQARNAATNEFERICWSPDAYRPMLKKVFVEYKMNVLKPYYTSEDAEGNVYYEYNKQVREILNKTYAEINSLVEGKVPESWKEFSVYLSPEHYHVKHITEFDEASRESGIITALRKELDRSLYDYISEVDFECYEKFVGEGMFGQLKYKKQWYFENFSAAVESFIDDLRAAISLQEYRIENRAKNVANFAVFAFKGEFEQELQNKVIQLENYVGINS